MLLWKNGNQAIKAVEIDASLLPVTRVCPWVLSPLSRGSTAWLKREDEVPFGLSGGKLRKYASILPWLLAHAVKTVVLIGSANSNHVVSATMILRERGIAVIPMLKQSRAIGTNQFLLDLLVPRTTWIWLSAAEWPMAEQKAAALAAQLTESGVPAMWLPEGACIPPAMPGAMTLARDLQAHQTQLGKFTDVFIDAGTGLSACALALGLQRHAPQAKVHVTLMADSTDGFWQKWQQFCEWAPHRTQEMVAQATASLVLHPPAFAASYGSMNAEVAQAIRQFAALGVLTDPIYSAKHLGTVARILPTLPSSSNAIVIHGGGVQSLPGYAHHFRHE